MVARERFEVLLIEDQVRHQQIYAAAITDSLPVTVRLASTGAEALAALRSESPPDLVVLDLEIPDTSGEALLATIKNEHRLRYTPVIILTGLSSYDKQMELLDRGADDFIEKGATPEVLIARLRAQMRHKLAVDRLERTALDRDLFAAGVLQDIGNAKWTITSLCRQAKESLRRDPEGKKAQILDCLQSLSSHATKLGAYATDVIQSVRDTHRLAKIAPQELPPVLDWAVQVLLATEDGPKPAALTWSAPEPLRPVLADKSLLRLALFNVLQHAVAQAVPSQPLTITITQSQHSSKAPSRERPYLTTRIRDDQRTVSPEELAKVFRSDRRASETALPYDVGISLVPKALARMEGQAWAELPTDGRPGLVICLDLPLAMG